MGGCVQPTCMCTHSATVTACAAASPSHHLCFCCSCRRPLADLANPPFPAALLLLLLQNPVPSLPRFLIASGQWAASLLVRHWHVPGAGAQPFPTVYSTGAGGASRAPAATANQILAGGTSKGHLLLLKESQLATRPRGGRCCIDGGRCWQKRSGVMCHRRRSRSKTEEHTRLLHCTRTREKHTRRGGLAGAGRCAPWLASKACPRQIGRATCGAGRSRRGMKQTRQTSSSTEGRGGRGKGAAPGEGGGDGGRELNKPKAEPSARQ